MFGGKVDVNGVVYATAFSQLSDERYKADITPLNGALSKVSKLRGYTYPWDRSHNPTKNFPAGRQVGLIAQQVEQVAPELVNTDAKGEKSVAYQAAIPLVIEAIKELEAQNAALQQRLDAMQK